MKRWSLLLLLTGCAVGPHYHRPDMTIPVEWEGGECTEMVEEPWVCWWQGFDDPILDELIAKAVACNFDLERARAKLCEARGHYKMVSGKLWPKLDLQYGMGEYRISDSYPFVVTQDRFAAFEFDFDAKWEVDIFGGKRRVQEARAHLEAEEEKRRSVLTSLIAEVARNYIDLRNFQNQRALLLKMRTVRRDELALTEKKIEESLSSANETARVRTHLLELEKQIEHLDEAIAHAKNHISLLVSDLPGGCQDRLDVEKALPSLPATLSIGLPSTLLCRRSDIREAERRLAAQTAHVGVAIADLFPKIDLTANVGYWSTILSQLFDPNNESSKYAGFIKWPFFEGGAILAEITKGKAAQRAALYDYTKTVLTAFHEVENRLLSYHKEGKRMRQQMEMILDRCTLLTGMEALNSQGLASSLQVNEERLALLALEQKRVESQARLATCYIALYKALGGGWEAFEE